MNKQAFLGTYRRARAIYHQLPPRQRVGMTPERLEQIMQEQINA